MYLWMKGIQFCSNKGPQPLPQGNNTKIVTKHINLHRTTKPIWTKCGSKHSWVNGIQVNLNEAPFLFPLEGGTVITCRILVVIFEFYFFLSQSPGISIALLKLMSNVALWPLVKAVGQLYNILWWVFFSDILSCLIWSAYPKVIGHICLCLLFCLYGSFLSHWRIVHSFGDVTITGEWL